MDNPKPLVSDDSENISHGDLSPTPQVEKSDVKSEAATQVAPDSAAPKEVESNVTVPENSVAPFAAKPVTSHDMEGRSAAVVAPKE
jgi:hypothetical protein